MNDKKFEKLNIKIVITPQQCTPIRNFNQFEERQILEPNQIKQMNLNYSSTIGTNMEQQLE